MSKLRAAVSMGVAAGVVVGVAGGRQSRPSTGRGPPGPGYRSRRLVARVVSTGMVLHERNGSDFAAKRRGVRQPAVVLSQRTSDGGKIMTTQAGSMPGRVLDSKYRLPA